MQVRRYCPSPAVKVQSLEFQVANQEAAPQNILEKIVWQKEKEVAQYRNNCSLLDLRGRIAKQPAPLNFAAALGESLHPTAVIAEVKKASPSKGVFREDFDPVTIAQAYAQHGASCISVLTDETFFQGSFANLNAIRQVVNLPLLCKDFILHPYQIYLARSQGADAILLIVSILSDQDLQYHLKIAQGLGLTVLVEVHSAEELERVLNLTVPPDVRLLLGINNRNLGTFETSLNTTVELLKTYGPDLDRRGWLVVSESGIAQPEDLTIVREAGARAVLVGESLIKQADPGLALAQLLTPAA